MLRCFSCKGYRTWPCLPLSSRVSLLFVLLLTRDVSPHNYQQARSWPFAIAYLHTSLLGVFACFLLLSVNLYSFFFELWPCLLLASELLSNWNNFLTSWISCNWLDNYFGMYKHLFIVFALCISTI